MGKHCRDMKKFIKEMEAVMGIDRAERNRNRAVFFARLACIEDLDRLNTREQQALIKEAKPLDFGWLSFLTNFQAMIDNPKAKGVEAEKILISRNLRLKPLIRTFKRREKINAGLGNDSPCCGTEFKRCTRGHGS